MRVLVGIKWRDDFLDEHRHPEEYRIQVLAWKNLEKLDNLYFIRPKSLRLLWNYWREIGLVEVWRKIVSRSQEQYRNQKYISCGLGRILESADAQKFPMGQIVAFLAPRHSPCLERVVLPSEFLIKVDQSDLPALSASTILYQPVFTQELVVNLWWVNIRGWSVYSGRVLSYCTSATLMKNVLESIRFTDWHKALILQVPEPSRITEVKEYSLAKRPLDRKNAVLFGYGNYAKTIILPNLKSYLSIDCIHEIDPTQISLQENLVRKWDTSPSCRDDENYDVFLIAGFHHTHTPLAIQALQRNAYAVVEKPIVVSQTQLTELIKAMQDSTGQLFACFHKRYLPFNELAISDLQIDGDEPINYHCIVYEVPLPELHWYKWQSSKSRLVSNGCHWIDHFLYLNQFAQVRSSNLVIAKDGTINCSVQLENGALLTMVLTDIGSERIGVQDYIELRANDVTIKMINGSSYLAEGKDRIIRRVKINKMQSYKLMYQKIGRKIVADEPGDSLQSVNVSAGLLMTLENQLTEQLNQQRLYETNPSILE